MTTWIEVRNHQIVQNWKTQIYDQRFKNDTTKEFRKSFEMNENENRIYQNLQDAVKPLFRGKL